MIIATQTEMQVELFTSNLSLEKTEERRLTNKSDPKLRREVSP